MIYSRGDQSMKERNNEKGEAKRKRATYIGYEQSIIILIMTF
jgi:hypothetical protein